MPSEIFNTVGMAESIRYTEYKDIYSAISEIVDNSIEANSKNIAIIMYVIEKEGNDYVDKIAVIDDGTGMDVATLQNCLVFGSSNRTSRDSIGRFGVGLGQASLYASSRVEVYSWQNSEKPKMVFLDTDLMKNGLQKEIPTPYISDFPIEFSYFNSITTYVKDKDINFKSNGTMVVWNKVDKINIKVSKFEKALAEDLGRKFRYYLSKGVKIIITDTVFTRLSLVKEIDPMFLSNTSKYLGDTSDHSSLTESIDTGEPIFEPLNEIGFVNGEHIIDVIIDDIRDKPTVFGKVIVRASYVKNKFYYLNHDISKGNKSNPGDTKIGKLLKKYESISMLRSQREIQFDKFGLYEATNTPTHRWWSIEIEFSNSLDELFKLSNNKQKVEITTLEKLNIDSSSNNHYFDSKEIEFWFKFSTLIKNTISFMSKRNKELAKSSRSVKEQSNTVSSNSKEKPYSKRNSSHFGNESQKNIDYASIKLFLESKQNEIFIEDISISDFFHMTGNSFDSKIVLNKTNDIYSIFENLDSETCLLLILYSFNSMKRKFVTLDDTESLVKITNQLLIEIINIVEETKSER